MSQSISKIQDELGAIEITIPLKSKPCLKCGGNGYMKTNPNCYHTCLSCLGKGLIYPEN